MDPRLFQQQSPQQFYLGPQSSTIPGAAGGRGDPGPSSMAQQQMHQQLQQQLQQQLMQSQQQQQQQAQGQQPQGQQPQQPRLPFNPATLQPQQLAMLQRLAQSNPNNQINQQQVQMALAGLQAAQGQAPGQAPPTGMSPQMLAAAMRPSQFAGGQLNPQQQQQLAQQLFAQQLSMQQGGAPAGLNQAQATQQAMQQQRLQQLMQAQAVQQQIQQQIQQQQTAQQSPQLASAGTPTQQHAGAGVMTPEMARIHMQQQQQQGRSSPSVGSPVRPNMPHPGSMPPPALPGASPQAQNMTPQQQSPVRPPGTFSLTPQQQQLLATQRQQMLSHPQFKSLPPAQQQQHLAQMQQKMLHVFLVQNQAQQQGGQPQPPQQQPPQQQQSPVHFSPSAQPQQPPGTQMPPQQPPTPTPRPPTPQAHQSPVPASSLPQHMVPNRPASAASQHAPSPHQSMGPGSPALRNTPPSTSQAQFGTPQPPPSPAHSNHSHHSHVPQTPKSQPTPSPMPPQDGGGPQMPGINGQIPGQPPFGQNPQAVQAIQALQQHAQNAQSFMHGPGGQPPNPQQMQGFPPGALPPGIPPQALQNMSPQQMAQAMNYFQQQQAAAAQAGVPVRPGMPMPPGMQGPGGVRPPPGQMRIPPLPPGINPAEFPFDARLIPFLQQINNPQWRDEMAQRNPTVLAEVQQIAHRIQTGQIRPEMLQRMQQFVMHMQRVTQQRMGQMPGQPGQPGQPPQPGMPPQRPPPGMPGYPGAPPPGMPHPGQPSPQHETPPNAMGQQQQRLWPGGQMGSPAPANVRPPPPHPAAGGEPPASGSLLARRTSSTKGDKQPRDAAMPPPTFIPAHGASPVRPPAEAQQPQAPAPPQSTSGLPVKEWEGALRLDIPTTAIHPLPTDECDEREDPTFGGKLPEMSDMEKEEVKSWLGKDIKFATGILDHRKKTHAKMQAWSEVEERQTPWWMLRKGEPRPRVPKHVNIIYPNDKALQRLKARKRKEIRFTPKQYKSMAEIEDNIVPVRLELEHEHNRFSDTFLWNCSDTVVTPELFAQSICDDFKLPAGQFVPKIVAAIKERVREYQDQVMPLQSTKKPELAGRGIIDEDDPETCTMVELFRQAHEADEEIRTDEGADQDDSHIRIVSFDDEVLDDKVMTVDEAMACLAPPADNDELRILIKIDIIVGTQNLVDTFEWDLNSEVTAEEFAQSYCIDLGLCGEFVTAIAHDIHEQVVAHQRSLFLVGHTQGSGYIANDDVRSAFLPPLTVALRKEDVAMSTFTPVLANFTEQDVIAIEKERERESKRKKRGTRGRRGIVLPDREPTKTFRTQLHPLIDPAVIAAADPAPHPMSSTRRAAAIAAQANINLALNETQPFLAPSPPPAVTHSGRGRGRWPGRGRGGGLSRASPSSTREGSVVNGDHTPNIGFKRSLREDSEPGLASPLPPRKRHNGRIMDSPEADEVDAVAVPPVPVRVPSPVKLWHCKNCGVPEHLSGGKRDMDLCAKCSDYMQRTGQQRPAAYNEDEEYHRLRNDSDSPKPPAFEMPVTPVVASPSRKRSNFDDSSSDSDSDSDDDDDDDERRRKKAKAAAKPVAAPVTPKVTSSSVPPATPQPAHAPTPPEWTQRAHATMQAKYPDHRFGIVLKSRPADAAAGAPDEWRVKCHDCPGRLYNPGPDETLNNFEVHLKNRQHRERVEARVAAKKK